MKTPPTVNALEAIAKLQAQIGQLTESAITELRQRKGDLERELETIDSDLEKLTGKPSGRSRKSLDTPAKKSVALAELRELLLAAPNQTLNIRRANLDFLNIKTLAYTNPSQLRLGGKAPWPTVTLVK